MNSQFIITNKIINFGKACEDSDFTIIPQLPNQSFDPKYLLTEKKPKHFINQRNITTVKYFNKIPINNSAPNLFPILMSPKHLNPSIPATTHEKEEPFCKICFETKSTPSTGRLISPCKCSGSVKFLHEECLKTWLVSQNTDLNFAACELCHQFYKMDIQVGLKFFPREICRQSFHNLLALACLGLFLACLIIIITLFSIQWSNRKDGDNGSFSYQIAIISSCSVVAFVVLILIYFTVRETCFMAYIKDWKIQDHRKKQDGRKKKPLIIDKKKTVPKPSFKIKTPSDVHKANILKRQIQNFFRRKAYSDSDFFREKKEKKEVIVKATIMRISSKIKLLENENQSDETNENRLVRKLHSEVVHCQRVVPQKMTTSLNHNQKNAQTKDEISEIFSKQIPQEFMVGDNQEEKFLDVLIETQTKK